MNILQVRYWHFTPINMRDKYISVEQLKFMYKLEGYHWWFYSKRELLGRLLKNLDMKFENILDAGCGTGQTLLFLKKFCPCYGCDIVRQALEFCRNNGLNNLVRCDLENTGFRDERFDVITSLDVLEHIEDPEKVLAEFKRILKKNGKVIITVPAFKFLWSQHDEALSHLRRYEKEDLIELVNDAGFRVEGQQAVARRIDLRRADARRGVDDLPLQVGQIHAVEIDQHQGADAGGCQIHGDG